MAEPTSTTAAAGSLLVSLGLASLLPGIDGNALIGAFAGATLFVLSANEYSLLTRLGYMAVSLVMGYLSAPEITARLPIEETGVAAFIAGLSCVYLGLKLQDQIKAINLTELIERMKP